MLISVYCQFVVYIYTAHCTCTVCIYTYMYWQLYSVCILYVNTCTYVYSITVSVLAQAMITRREEESCNACLLENFVPGAICALIPGAFGTLIRIYTYTDSSTKAELGDFSVLRLQKCGFVFNYAAIFSPCLTTSSSHLVLMSLIVDDGKLCS